MNTAGTPTPTRILLAAAGLTFAVGVSGAAAASSDTEPADDATEHTEHEMAPTPTAGEPTSPEAEALCAAEIAAEAAFNSEDPEAIGPAVEAFTAAAEPVGLTDAVGALLAAAEEGPGGPEFEEAYAAIIDYMKANCGYVELNVAASEYQFDGLPSELPAGPVIIGLENVGEQVHEIFIARINDDVTLSVEELLALPEEEAQAMTTPTAFAFTFPGDTGYGTADLTPGRYVALCFLPEGATPEVLMELEELGVTGPDDTLPEGAPEVGPPHFTLGMVHEFTVT